MPARETLILHVDVDAFFASVEQLLIPALLGRPVVVGSGVIASCSYEARRFDLRAGMPLHEARRRCPEALFIKGDYQTYRCFADQIWEICRDFTCGLETYLDEAYGDATGMDAIHGDPLALGRKLQARVRRQVGLPVSIGLAGNRMLAKIASGLAKPTGVIWVRPEQQRRFLTDLPIEKLPGVGGKTGAKLRDMNIETVGNLRSLPREFLRSMFGQQGLALYERSRGRDGRIARDSHFAGTISRETTFHEPTRDPGQIRGMLFYLLERALLTLRRHGLLAKCLELSIRYDDWRAGRCQRSLPNGSDCEQEVFAVVLELLDRLYIRRVALRHVRILLSDFMPRAAGTRLFEPRDELRHRRLHHTLDRIRERYGHAAIVAGKSIELLGKLHQNHHGFVLRTPSLTK